MEALRRELGREHDDRLRLEVEGERAAHFLDALLRREVEMRDLAPRMDAGVGAAGALHVDALAAEGEHGVLERRLDRRAGVLALPADERPAVVLDGDLVARHGSAGRVWGSDTTAGEGSTVPAGKAKPRRKASAACADLPGRCSFRSRKPPTPQATTGKPSRATLTVPGAPPASASAASSTLICSPLNANDVPGQGWKARTLRSSSAAGRRQSSTPSSLPSLWA